MMIMMMMMMMMMVMMMLMMMMIDEVLFFCVTRQDAGAGLQGQRPRVHLATGLQGHESTWLQAASPQGQRPERVLHGLRWRAPSS